MEGATAPAPISVSEAVARAKRHVSALGSFTVTGEVTGFRGQHRTGHCYFQVKDAASSMDVIVWRGVYESSGVPLADGLLVEMVGSFDVYDKTGKMSFVVKKLSAAGEGVLRMQVAQLAQRLAAEGLMADERKRPIPTFCERICMVTSLSGSVREDVRRTLLRRNPLVEIDIVGCAVQGPEAPATIIRALAHAAATSPDAILLVRGGGSFEDLMCFNDEALARAIAACPVPVVTGIGHEPDTSIADMVADRRCSTPTAAAESVAPAATDLISWLDAAAARMERVVTTRLSLEAQHAGELAVRSKNAVGARIGALAGWLDMLSKRPSLTNPHYLLDRRKTDLAYSEQRLADAAPRALVRESHAAERARARLSAAGAHLLAPHERLLASCAASLDALSPLRVLGRGYAIARSEDGHVLKRAADARAGELIEVLLGEGALSARVDRITQTRGSSE